MPTRRRGAACCCWELVLSSGRALQVVCLQSRKCFTHGSLDAYAVLAEWPADVTHAVGLSTFPCNGRVLIANYEMVKKLGQQRAAAFRTVIVDESHHLKVGSDHSIQAAAHRAASGVVLD